MIVALDQLETLLTDMGLPALDLDLADLKTSNSFNIDKNQINFQNELDLKYLNVLKTNNVERVSICLEKEHLNFLRSKYPNDFKKYQFEENAQNIRARLASISKINAMSNKKRHLILKQDLLGKQGANSEVMYRVDDLINEEMLNRVAKVRGNDYTVQFSYREDGVLVFVDEPVKNISLRIDIIALYSSFDYPIYYGETMQEAITLFEEKFPRLVVFTNLEKSWESKELFLELIEQDAVMKFLNYDKSPSSNRATEGNKIKAVYDDNYDHAVYKLTSRKSKVKPNLESKHRNPVMDRMESLRNSFSQKGFVELKYYLFRLGDKYNVATIENILSKIKEPI